MLIDYDVTTGSFTALGTGKAVAAETTWTLILESGVLQGWANVDAIAMAIGKVTSAGRVSGHTRRQIREALRGRAVDVKSERRRGQDTTLYRLAGVEDK